MKIELLLLGKTKASYIEKGIQDYAQRLSHYTSVDLTTIKVKSHKGMSPDETKNYESSLMQEKIRPGDFRIVLDSRGAQLSSEALSVKITTLEQQGVKKSCVIIGGPLGLSGEQLEKADMVLSLSKMTFPHDLVRLLVLEQLYRAYTIKAGEKYHK